MLEMLEGTFIAIKNIATTIHKLVIYTDNMLRQLIRYYHYFIFKCGFRKQSHRTEDKITFIVDGYLCEYQNKDNLIFHKKARVHVRNYNKEVFENHFREITRQEADRIKDHSYLKYYLLRHKTIEVKS